MSLEAESGKKEVSGEKAWRAHIRAWKKSGLSGRDYCRQYKLSYYAFAYWKKKLEGSKTSSVELVPLPSAVQLVERGAALHVEVNGYRVEVMDGFTPATLARMITTLEGCR